MGHHSAAGGGVVIGEAVWRAARQRPPGSTANTLETVAVIAVLVTAAGGLGLLIGGSGPHEPLHILYGVLAFGALPVAGSLSRNASSSRQAVSTIVGGVVLVVLLARLFQTG